MYSLSQVQCFTAYQFCVLLLCSTVSSDTYKSNVMLVSRADSKNPFTGHSWLLIGTVQHADFVVIMNLMRAKQVGLRDNQKTERVVECSKIP